MNVQDFKLFHLSANLIVVNPAGARRFADTARVA
jgi:hypothetical protein